MAAAGKIRDAEAAAEVEPARRRREPFGKAHEAIEGSALHGHERFGIEALRAGEEVQPAGQGRRHAEIRV